jgi:hypothetical protein
VTRKPLTSQIIPTGVIVVIALLLFFVLLIAIRAGYSAGWTGFGEVPTKETTTINTTADGVKEIAVTKEVQQPRTVWDWMSLVFIPLAGGLAIAIVGYLFNKKQREREEAVETLRAQDEALQAYLDQMSDLLINQSLRPEGEDSKPKRFQKFLEWVSNREVDRDSGSEPADTKPKGYVRDVAAARTIAVLLGLDREHKRRPLKLVCGLGLIKRDDPVLSLKNAGLDHADLSELSLQQACLRGADLRGADLSGADLSRSSLREADLRGADLTNADLTDVDLSGANLLPYAEGSPARLSIHNLNDRYAVPSHKELRRIKLKANLTRVRLANTIPTKLTNTKLEGAKLEGAVLANVNLKSVRGLEQEMVDGAIGNDKTELPQNSNGSPLERPRSWNLSIEEQLEKRKERSSVPPSREPHTPV